MILNVIIMLNYFFQNIKYPESDQLIESQKYPNNYLHFLFYCFSCLKMKRLLQVRELKLEIPNVVTSMMR